jgi:hypothetical protein
MGKLAIYGAAGVTIVAVMLGMAAIGAALFMVAWNFVMPTAFGLPELGFWQSLALSMLLVFVCSCFKAAVRKSSD